MPHTSSVQAFCHTLPYRLLCAGMLHVVFALSRRTRRSAEILSVMRTDWPTWAPAKKVTDPTVRFTVKCHLRHVGLIFVSNRNGKQTGFFVSSGSTHCNFQHARMIIVKSPFLPVCKLFCLLSQFSVQRGRGSAPRAAT